MNFENFSIEEYKTKLLNKEFSCETAVKYFVDKAKKDKKNALVEVFDSALENAKKIDAKIKKGEKLGSLVGVPIVIKDNILFAGHKGAAGSRMLENFVSPYSATVVEKLVAADAVIIARANMDEMAMGVNGKHSAFGKTLNALSDKHLPGGSSSGSAVALAADMCLAALGTDTGGSVRYPAAQNGIFGLKPTYGSVSRYGVVAFASGIEQVGVFAKDGNDTKIVFDIIKGKDIRDARSLAQTKQQKIETPYRVGYIKEIWDAYKDAPHFALYQQAFERLKKNGCKVVEVSIPQIKNADSIYYALALPEAASNLGRFDGVRYSPATDAENLDELYNTTRTNLFGTEVKRRIMLGNFMLTASGIAEYYKRGLGNQAILRSQFEKAFSGVDFFVLPVSYGTAKRVDEETNDPVKDYVEDLFTCPASLVGLPAVSTPLTEVGGLPLGMQILGNHFAEDAIFEFVKFWEKLS